MRDVYAGFGHHAAVAVFVVALSTLCGIVQPVGRRGALRAQLQLPIGVGVPEKTGEN
jgi:hypothetical protein